MERSAGVRHARHRGRRDERAALLVGAFETYLGEGGVESRLQAEIQTEAGFLDRGRVALGDEVHGRLRADGRSLDEIAALELATAIVGVEAPSAAG